MSVAVYIPTRGRPNLQKTSDMLTQARIKHYLVCSQNDVTLKEYAKKYSNVIVVNAKGISDKRQKIMEMDGDKFVMMDDDLTFFVRRSLRKFKKAEPSDMRVLVKWFDKILSSYAHAGMVDKFMCQTRPRGFVTSGRYAGVLGYSPKIIRNCMHYGRTPKFRLPVNEEHDMHLQLLSLGLKPAITCEFSKDSKYYLAGGLTGLRTPKVEKQSFKTLLSLWPDYVKLREGKNAIGGVAATINWRRAANDGEA